MAFTKTPEQTTHLSHRFDLAASPETRDGIGYKDARLVNVFPELFKSALNSAANSKKTYHVKERPGLGFSLANDTGEGRGMTYFNGYTFAVIANQLYRDGSPVKTLGTSTGSVGFTDYKGTYSALILLDGIKGWVIKTDNSITEITSGDFPTPHVCFPIAADGYLLVAKAGTDDMYNSDFEDPLGWTAGNFITAEMYPDTIKALSYNNNYILAIGTASIEFFYDAGVATGSPFQRNETAVQQFGCLAPETVVSTEKETIFIGNTINGGFTGWTINGFKAVEFTIEPIKQSLEAEGSSITNAKGNVFRVLGHKFYLLNLTSRSWVYDFEEQVWHEWSYGDTTTPFCCNYVMDKGDGRVYMLHDTNGSILYLDPTTATDTISAGETTTIPVEIVTEKIDFETMNSKTCSKLSIVGEAATSDVNIYVQWSDDDYVTYSTARTLILNGLRPQITQLGRFRRRAFKFTYNDVYPLKLRAFEIDVNIGQQ